jgi:hypothetical protein
LISVFNSLVQKSMVLETRYQHRVTFTAMEFWC